MKRIRELLSRLTRDKRGTTAIEYALIGSLISVFILGAVSIDGGLAGTLGDFFNTIDESVNFD